MKLRIVLFVLTLAVGSAFAVDRDVQQWISAAPPGPDRLVREPANKGATTPAEPRITRSRSRIGPQPWPADLPEDWPQPDQAQVLADTRQGNQGRLLLVDLPAAPDEALDAYRTALDNGGFVTQRARVRRTPPALHVRRGEQEAVLTFIDRDDKTRLEILFIGATAS